jgi:starch phosphorylase
VLTTGITDPSADLVEQLKLTMLRNLQYRLAKDEYSATTYDRFLSVAYAVFERMIEQWLQTQEYYHWTNPKRVYYLSMEFLLGRSLSNALLNRGLTESCAQALRELGVDLDELAEVEVDAGLGNGGLGRLAACFLDSMATLGIPSHGYGLRYDYGLFRQQIVQGRQVEAPDRWLALPNPWEIIRPEFTLKIRFGGRLEAQRDALGEQCSVWVDGTELLAMPYDMPVPGFRTETTNTLRLWTAHSDDAFNFDYFNHGDYMRASEEQVRSENITKVLYPNDNFFTGKELRLKQEYFLVSASVQDIVRRFKSTDGLWCVFPDKVAIQLNDTHPSLAIPELMRILLDDECLCWEEAWAITTATFAYTNHTVLPEALEEWPVSLLEAVLPRHLDIIYKINHYFLLDVATRYPGDVDRLRRMSLIGEDGVKRVRMAHLATVGSHAVNGVAALHTHLLKTTILRDFDEFWPGKISNKTNGITPRRWLASANPPLAALITGAIGEGWLTDLTLLRKLEPLADDPDFRQRWTDVQQQSKSQIIELVRREHGLELSSDALFDVQVKRIHEYKRQLLFGLFLIATYLRIKDGDPRVVVPRVCLVAGKAAPGYQRAKLIIRLINAIAERVNADADTRDWLRVAFLPNYSVSLAEKIIPAADLSEQIATAGMEASGTSNMKFALNGALTIGTLDGANVEIRDEVGAENIFIFGHTVDELQQLRAQGYDPRQFLRDSAELQRVVDLIYSDFFSPSDPGLFRPLIDELVTQDTYFLLADFDAYLACQDRVSAAYRDQQAWTRMSMLNVARSGMFSSDRTIMAYAKEIWGATPVKVKTALAMAE